MQTYSDTYSDLFRCHRKSNSKKVYQYLSGLFHEGKHNIERMNERIVDSNYDALHHFISESPWDHRVVLSRVRQDISKLFDANSAPVGLLLDESGHPKRGKSSVGVARQYLGSVGKKDNGQVGVFAALSQGNEVGMVNARLYLPQNWSNDRQRCDKAGIPKEEQRFRTKPELALEMLKEMEEEINYDWIGADCIYGASPHLRAGIEQLGKSFVMDVREHLKVYLEDPAPYIPARTAQIGRKKSSWVSDHQPVQLKDILPMLAAEDWTLYRFRPGTKGPLERVCHCREVFLWSDRRPTTEKAQHLRLIISRNADETEIKYSLTNEVSKPNGETISERELLYRQMQRYWVERAFQDCKDSLGMTDYQVRKWRAWYHHICLTIMALHFMLEQKIKHKTVIPLLSCPDIKFFLAMTLTKKADNPDKVWELIQVRHQQRQADLNRYKS